MSLLNRVFRRDKGLIAIEELDKLEIKFIKGISEDKDLAKWDKYIKILIDSAFKNITENPYVYELYKDSELLDDINKAFAGYLIKHHPNDVRLKYNHKGDQNIDIIRQRKTMCLKWDDLTPTKKQRAVQSYAFMRAEEEEDINIDDMIRLSFEILGDGYIFINEED